LIDVCQHSRAFSVLKGAGSASIGYSFYFSARTLFECYIGIILDFDATQYSAGCPPVTGEPNGIGDRTCHHYNWRGSLDVLPADVFTTSHSKPGSTRISRYPYYVLGTGTSAQGFNILSQYGASGTAFFSDPFIYSGKQHTRSLDITWSWREERILIVHLAYATTLSETWQNVSVIFEFDKTPTRDNIKSLRSRQRTNVLWSEPTNSIFDDTMPVGAWLTPKLTAVASQMLVPSDKHAVQTALRNEGERFELCLPDTPKEMWGDLADVAVQNARSLDINSIEFARDLVKLKDSCDSIIMLLRGKPNLRKLADAWLTFKYGFRLLISDATELGHALGDSIVRRRNKKFSTCRAMEKSVSIATKGPLRDHPVLEQYNLKIYYSPDSDKFLSLCRVMMDWDTFPSLQNIWDLIPLSFVVDWFTDFSRTLSRIDTNTYISTVDVQGVIETRKSYIQSIPADKLCLPGGAVWSGCLDLDIYSRQLPSHLTLPLLRFGSPREFHNIVELTAIIIQKWKR